MIIRKQAEAYYSGFSGSCSNGLGSPVNTTTWTGSSIGESYEVRNWGVPTSEFEVTCTPTATASVPSGGSGGWPSTAHASVRFKATPTPVRIKMNGATLDESADPSTMNLLIGQFIQFEIEAGFYSLQDIEWEVGKGAFEGASWGAYSNGAHAHHQIVDLEPGDLDDPTVECYYSEPIEEESVTCIASVVVDEQVVAEFAISDSLEVWKPEFASNLAVSDGNHYGSIQGWPSVIAGLSNSNYGARVEGWAITPPLFTYGGNLFGKWYYSQLVMPWRMIDSEEQSGWCLTEFVLDNWTIYPAPPELPAAPWSAFAILSNDPPIGVYHTRDAPGNYLGSIDFDIHDMFKWNQVYIPPRNSQFEDSETIALTTHRWMWTAAAVKSGGTWPEPTGGVDKLGDDELFQLRDWIWDDVLTNL